VAGQNIFKLSAKFVSEGQTQSTDYLDISQYAGQTVEVFFGLAGGTSENCALVVDGIRFMTIPQPTLAIQGHGSTVSLHWPAAINRAPTVRFQASPGQRPGSRKSKNNPSPNGAKQIGKHDAGFRCRDLTQLSQIFGITGEFRLFWR
jgi:hypothetical protein